MRGAVSMRWMIPQPPSTIFRSRGVARSARTVHNHHRAPPHAGAAGSSPYMGRSRMAGPQTPPVPKPVQLFVVRLSTTMKSQRLYPTGSDIPHRSALDAIEALQAVLGDGQY